MKPVEPALFRALEERDPILIDFGHRVVAAALDVVKDPELDIHAVSVPDNDAQDATTAT